VASVLSCRLELIIWSIGAMGVMGKTSSGYARVEKMVLLTIA